MASAEYVIVGSGLTGSVIARELADAGRSVLVLERRDTVGGNCSDIVNHGIRMNLYGPHYFRTSSDAIWEYVQRFSEFIPFEAVVKSCVNGHIYDWPITQEMVDMYPKVTSLDNPANFEEACLSRIPKPLYEKLIRGYTERQWGKSAKDMDKSLASRIEIRQGNDRRLSTKKYQGVPKDGYTNWIQKMLDGIPVQLGVNYLETREEYQARKLLVFTGAIDSLFRHDLGHLQYRSQLRTNTYFENTEWRLPACQINYPGMGDSILREIEWKHIWLSDTKGTLITAEMPISGGEEYPVPDKANQVLYQRYRNRVDSTDRLLVEGRMGRNRYQDMDESIARALKIAREIIRDK